MTQIKKFFVFKYYLIIFIFVFLIDEKLISILEKLCYYHFPQNF